MRRFIILSLLAVSALGHAPAFAQTTGQQAQTAQQPRTATPPGAQTAPSAPGAATGPGMMGPGMMGQGMMGQGMGPGMMGYGMMGGRGMYGDGAHDIGGMLGSKHVEGRIAFLKTELKITEAQTTAWSAFADAMRNSAKIMDALDSSRQQTPPANPATVSVIDRMAQREAYLSARLKALTTLREAMSKLYPTLTEEQKTTANELIGAHLGLFM